MKSPRLSLATLAMSGLTALGCSKAEPTMRFSQARPFASPVAPALPEAFPTHVYAQRIEMARAWRAYQEKNLRVWSNTVTPPPPTFSYDRHLQAWTILPMPPGMMPFKFDHNAYAWRQDYPITPASPFFRFDQLR